MTATTILFFFLMILAPIAVATLAGLRQQEESIGATPVAVPVANAPRSVAPLPVTSGQLFSLPSRSRSVTLEAIAGKAEKDARLALAAAARARAAALVAAARAASARAEVAAEAADAAALVAAHAARIAMAAREAQALQNTPAPRDLPANHPSLDFPRSRVIRNAA